MTNIYAHGGILGSKMKAALITLMLCMSSGYGVGVTDAAFTASVTVPGNSVTAGVWSPESLEGGAFELAAGDVVINEVMWMGTSLSSADEWIELRNMTDETIDLTGWSIEGAGEGSAAVIIPSGSIEPHGFFLISNYAADESALADGLVVDHVTTAISLDNSGEQLTLWSDESVQIDQTPAGGWAEGLNDTGTPLRQSMERNSVPGDGTLDASWHTCIAPGCNDGVFWDAADGTDYGTPRATNLSENDPTADDFVPETFAAGAEAGEGEVGDGAEGSGGGEVVIDDGAAKKDEGDEIEEDVTDEDLGDGEDGSGEGEIDAVEEGDGAADGAGEDDDTVTDSEETEEGADDGEAEAEAGEGDTEVSDGEEDAEAGETDEDLGDSVEETEEEGVTEENEEVTDVVDEGTDEVTDDATDEEDDVVDEGGEQEEETVEAPEAPEAPADSDSANDA